VCVKAYVGSAPSLSHGMGEAALSDSAYIWQCVARSADLPCSVHLSQLPSIDIESISPRAKDRRYSAWAGDVDLDQTRCFMIRPDIPFSAEFRYKFSCEDIITSDRRRPLVNQCTTEIDDHFAILTRYARPSPSSTRPTPLSASARKAMTLGTRPAASSFASAM